jgi:hypothetical protein
LAKDRRNSGFRFSKSVQNFFAFFATNFIITLEC